MTSRISLKPIFIILFFAFCTLTYAALSYRALFSDGAYWFFKSIHEGKIFWDGHFYRMTDSLPLLPMVLYVKWFQPEQLHLAVYIGSLALLLHPFLSLFICYRILKKENREELILFPALSFAITVYSIQIFAVACVQVTLSLFWPLFFLAISKNISLIKIWIISIVLIALGFSYEAGTVLIGLITLILGYRRFYKKETIMRLPFYIGCLILIWMAYRLSLALAIEYKHISDSLETKESRYFYIGFFTLISLAISLIINAFNLPWKVTSIRLTYFLFVYLLLLYVPRFVQDSEQWSGSFWRSWSVRIFSAPISASIAILCLIFILKKIEEQRRRVILKTFRNFTFSILLIGIGYDYTLSFVWNSGVKKIRGIQKASAGCILVSGAEYKNNVAPTGLPPWSISFLSIFLENSRNVSKFIIANPETTNYDLCKQFNEKGLKIPSGESFYIPLFKSGFFRFPDELVFR